MHTSENIAKIRYIPDFNNDQETVPKSKKRFWVGVGVFVVYALLFVLSFVSNNNVQTSFINLETEYRFVISLILYIWLALFLIVSIGELNSAFAITFKNRKAEFIINNFVGFCCFSSGVITVLLKTYWIQNETNSLVEPFFGNKSTLTNSLLVISLPIFIYFITSFTAAKFLMKWDLSRTLTYVGLSLLIVLGYFAFFYLAIVQTWSSLLFVLLIPVLNDTLAFAFGKIFGRTKLARSISPNKTVEGALLGFIFSVLLLCLYFYLISLDKTQTTINLTGNTPQQYSVGVFNLYNILNIFFEAKTLSDDAIIWLALVLLTVVLSIVSICGDLLFSWVKRKIEIKDFGKILQGHGGLLDRIDSLVSVSFVYFLFLLGTTYTSTY